MNTIPIETERKFLIFMPDIDTLLAQPQIRVKKITQTYVINNGNKNSRVRKIEENGCVKYIQTTKERISALSCYEDEHEISAESYAEWLKFADNEKQTINKTRYAFAYESHTLEIDVYSFWNDRATLEIELSSEDESFEIPSFIKIIKEVSLDGRYKNTNLAKSVPHDEI